MKLDPPIIPAALTEHYELPDEDEYENCLFDGVIAPYEKLYSREFRSCVFRKCTLTDVDFAHAGFVDVIFDHCDLSRCNFETAVFKDRKSTRLNSSHTS